MKYKAINTFTNALIITFLGSLLWMQSSNAGSLKDFFKDVKEEVKSTFERDTGDPNKDAVDVIDGDKDAQDRTDHNTGLDIPVDIPETGKHANRAKVRKAQQRLTELGYDTRGVDGKVGPGTKQAIEKFQLDKDLNVTGELDEQTLDALENA